MTAAADRERDVAAAPVATVALAAVTAAVALGMGRLFAGASYLLPLLAAAGVAHAGMWAGRRYRWPLAGSALAAVGGAALVATWSLFPETATLGVVPGPATLAAGRDALAAAWRDFGTVVAPTPATDGFLLAAMVGLATTAVLADWAAFRMRVLFEAVVPSFTLFVFTATLGDDGRRSLMVALYLATLLPFLVLHRAGLESEGTSWFASRARGGPGALLQGAAGLVLVAVAAAVVVGPRLPGAAAEALVDWRGDGPGGRGRRTTVSPLVDIRGRLVDQSRTEVFTVRADQRAYWRLTSLDTFDGRIWSSDASYQPVGERLPPPGRGAATAPGDRFEQEFTIRSLSSIWLPAAYRPERVEGAGDVSYNDDLGSLITGEDTTDGLAYRVQSTAPRLDAEALAGAVAAPRTIDVDRFTRLPPVDASVRQLAATLARGAGRSPYARALAIQEHFRQGFVYDLDVGAGHDEEALERFLFVDRRGYCEQFAGAFAVLARAVGLPTRVAVGFTPGAMGDDGLFHVRGLNAHAWPEVFLEGFGWVAFEPTPGRGAPRQQEYLGVAEAQASPQDATTATTAGAPTTAAPDDLAVPPDTAAPVDDEAPAGGGAGRPPLWRHPAVVAVAAVAAAVAGGAGTVLGAKALRRRRRRAAAADPAQRVWVAW
ncbi:MAG: transglutaminaseTgpA domain-containing protein, partial [Acidimicrobiia bacterium]